MKDLNNYCCNLCHNCHDTIPYSHMNNFQNNLMSIDHHIDMNMYYCTNFGNYIYNFLYKLFGNQKYILQNMTNNIHYYNFQYKMFGNWKYIFQSKTRNILLYKNDYPLLCNPPYNCPNMYYYHIRLYKLNYTQYSTPNHIL